MAAKAAKGETAAKTARSEEEQKAADIAEVKAILAAIPPPSTHAIETYRRQTRTDDLARERPIPAPSQHEMTPERAALINEAMGNWARGHNILARMDPEIRSRVRALAEQLIPE